MEATTQAGATGTRSGVYDPTSVTDPVPGATGTGSVSCTNNGKVQFAFATDAWGNTLSEQKGAVAPALANEDNPFLFLGGLGYWNEPNVGLCYVRARWLDTGTGQWLSVDPVDGEPRYSYAYQSPALFTDASGTQASGAQAHTRVQSISGDIGPTDARLLQAYQNSKGVLPGRYGYFLWKSVSGSYYLSPLEYERTYWFEQPGNHAWYTLTNGEINEALTAMARGLLSVFDADNTIISYEDPRVLLALQGEVDRKYTAPDTLTKKSGSLLLMRLNGTYVFLEYEYAGKPKKIVHAHGFAGAIIDHWFVDEVKAQIAGLDKWLASKSTKYVLPYKMFNKVNVRSTAPVVNPFIEKILNSVDVKAPAGVASNYHLLLDWANGNELYKIPDIFPFNEGLPNCGTTDQGAEVGGSTTITLFERVITTSTLGNIVYGFIAHYVGWTREFTISIPRAYKDIGHKVRPRTVSRDPYDSYSYAMGWDMCDLIRSHGFLVPTGNKKYVPNELLRAAFNYGLAHNPDALLEGRGDLAVGGVNDYSTCRPCYSETRLIVHGGGIGPVGAPAPQSPTDIATVKDEFIKHSIPKFTNK